MQDNAAVSIRSNEDISDVWQQVLSGKNIVLWCDGIATTSSQGKWKRQADSSDDEVGTRKKKKRKSDEHREQKVEKLVQNLKAKHGDTKYTPMQFRVWGEVLAGGVHTSDNDPPSTSMFVHCGNVPNKRKSTSDVVVEAIENIASNYSF